MPGLASLEGGGRNVKKGSSSRKGGRGTGRAEGKSFPLDPVPEGGAVEAGGTGEGGREGGRGECKSSRGHCRKAIPLSSCLFLPAIT